MSLSLYGEIIDTFFDLLGKDENALTMALGWNLNQNYHFLMNFISKTISLDVVIKDVYVYLQRPGNDNGFTDIELIINEKYHLILEAKKGWNLPSKGQISKYKKRYKKSTPKNNFFIVISDCKRDFALGQIRKFDLKFPVYYTTWRDIIDIIDFSYKQSNNFQKKLLNEFRDFVEGVKMSGNQGSNEVFCVSLSKRKAFDSNITWIDIVEKYDIYFYPVGSNWPKEPPNYMAFRYDGKLQAIRHVENFEISDKLDQFVPVPEKEYSLHFVLELGPSFKPKNEVRNGNIWSNGRVWFDLDTVFNCNTIKEAIEISKERYNSE
jgi:hypothetical protein